MIILGIDPGLAHTGWGVVETFKTQVRARSYGCVSTNADEPLQKRLISIVEQIQAVIARYNVEHVAIEKIFFGQNSKSAIPTAHARGAALVACAGVDTELGEYTPMQIKQAIVGTGAADKNQVIYMVRHFLNLDHNPEPDHAADALAAAICHSHILQTDVRLDPHGRSLVC